MAAECEFESPKICGYTQDAGDDFDWTRGTGETYSWNTGPKTDHTYGTASGTSADRAIQYKYSLGLV